MYKIGELSRLCRIPVKTLRFYDREGLLVPDGIDRFKGYRYYSAARIADCNRIISLKELGFSLKEIELHQEIILGRRTYKVSCGYAGGIIGLN